MNILSRNSCAPTVWRQGFAKVLTLPCLEALAAGLRADDHRIVQGSTTFPPPMLSMSEHECAGGDAIGFALWQGKGLQTVGQVEENFYRICYEVDKLLGEPAAGRWFLVAWDEADRDEAFATLLTEVEAAIAMQCEPITV